MPGQRPSPRGRGCPESGSGRRWGRPGEDAAREGAAEASCWLPGLAGRGAGALSKLGAGIPGLRGLRAGRACVVRARTAPRRRLGTLAAAASGPESRPSRADRRPWHPAASRAETLRGEASRVLGRQPRPCPAPAPVAAPPPPLPAPAVSLPGKGSGVTPLLFRIPAEF